MSKPLDESLRKVAPPTIVRGFDVSRRKLTETLKELTFMKVTVLTFPESAVRGGTHFQGECVEVFPGRHTRERPRTAFFSRYARQTGTGLSILGGFTLIDCPVSMTHPTAVPQVGDILVGSLMPAKKGKMEMELRGWCNNAKPLLELARIVQFGSGVSEKELQMLLRQPASSAASFMLRLNKTMVDSEKQQAQRAAGAADDFWALARIVCYRRLDEDKSLKCSKPFVEMVDTLAMRFGDEELVEEWSKVRPEEYVPEPVAAAPAPVFGTAGGAWGASGTWNPQSYAQGPWTPAAAVASAPAWSAWQSQQAQAWNATISPPSPGSKTPPYAPSSPTYAPSSPTYAPSSPKEPPPPTMGATPPGTPPS